MKKIDSHQHFWKFDPVRYSWINDEMKIIRKDFLPANLEPILLQNNFDGCVTVQSDQSEAENIFQLQNAEKYNFIKGIVGWVDLRSKNIEERLQHYVQFPQIKGFRHVLQDEPERDMMLHAAFMNGVSFLEKYNYTYDILIFADQLQYVPKFVSAFPSQPFVIDHIAKPNIKAQTITDWKKDIVEVAQFENVFCKISGMVTEADWKQWKPEDFTQYLDVIVECFGIDKIMFGSDWPVCLVAASYEKMLSVVQDYFSSFSKNEQEKFFGLNAINFYKL